VTTARADAAGKDFDGTYARGLMHLLSDLVGSSGIDKVLAAAGESRSLSDLTLETTWSTYAQTRALLEAAAALLGGPEKLIPAGRRIIDHGSTDANLTIPTGESPNSLFANISAVLSITSRIIEASAEQIGENDWRVSQTFGAGFESFEAFCAMQAGGYSIIPAIYGLPPAEVTEEQCSARGAPSCVFRVRWRAVDPATQQLRLLEARVRGLETWLDEFQQTVTNLVSSQDLREVLEQTFTAACRAVHAPVCVLALRRLPMPAGGGVFSLGIDAQAAEELAARLLTEDDEPETHLIAEVSSARRIYGRIAAVRTVGEFMPEQRRRLESYARLIAAALDSEFAIAEANRQSQGARALLELSTSLAQITTVEEVPEKLARAVPGVMGVDQVAVLMTSADRSHWTISATHGYPSDVDKALRRRKFPMPRMVHTGATIIRPGELPPSMGPLIGAGGAMMVPIMVNEEWAGSIIAPIDEVTASAGIGREDEERLEGLAAQASTAIYNAMLLSQVRHQALHDPLTGLPNRALILDRAEQMLTRNRGAHHAAAALFIDLDGFKEVNDTFGHAAGDELLLTFAGRLEAVLRSSDTVGRLGGDEFVVLLEDTSTIKPEQVAERLLAVAREPFTISQARAGRLSVTASIGIASGNRANAGQLLRDADVALYDAKATGKNRFVIFREQMQISVHDRVLMQMDLQNALRDDQFALFYQPCFDLSSGRVTGVEASARWSHPIRGQIDGAEFGPLLAENEALIDVGRWMFTNACKEVAGWHQKGLAVNLGLAVSSQQLHDASFLPDLAQVLDNSGLPAANLIIEVSEQAVRTDQKETLTQLESLHTLGVRIAVDGFGTGAFSLTSLRELPIDILKIDKTFVQGMSDSPESAALVRSLIQLSAALGLRAIGDGIEQKDHCVQLLHEGCNSGLGPFLSPPLPGPEVEAVLRTVREF
jgi:diguanylate cyclase (GGDEF)-like protein